MTTINVYLTFDGNCEEAFQFYRSAFKGEFSYVGRFKDMPPQEGAPAVSEEMGNKIMHISLPISKETVLMGSDTGGDWGGANHRKGNNFSICVSPDKKEEADRLFAALSEGGKVNMPLMDTFWGDYFGMCEDKFGVNWMMSYNEQYAEKMKA